MCICKPSPLISNYLHCNSFMTELALTFGSHFFCAFLRLITPLLPSGSWINGWKNPTKTLPAVNRIPPRAFQDTFPLCTTSEPHLQPGPGIAIRNIARAKLLFQALSSITATITAPYRVLVIATALAPAHSLAPAQVPAHTPASAQVTALARVTAQSPVQV